MESENLPARAKEIEAIFRERLGQIADTHDVVGEAAEQGEVDAIDVAADGGKDGETK